MMGDMNEHQKRAIWAKALQDMADAIGRGQTRIPDSVRFYTHDVTPEELLEIADHTAPEPLRIKNSTGLTPHVTVPTGKPLQIEFEWVFLASSSAGMDKIFDIHNQDCCGLEPAAPGAEPAGTRASEVPSVGIERP